MSVIIFVLLRKFLGNITLNSVNEKALSHTNKRIKSSTPYKQSVTAKGENDGGEKVKRKNRPAIQTDRSRSVSQSLKNEDSFCKKDQ